MWFKIIPSLILAQPDKDKDGSPWLRLLPFIVIIVLSGLSSLMKAWQEKKKKDESKPRSTPGPFPSQSQPSARRTPLPGYARQAQQKQGSSSTKAPPQAKSAEQAQHRSVTPPQQKEQPQPAVRSGTGTPSSYQPAPIPKAPRQHKVKPTPRSIPSGLDRTREQREVRPAIRKTALPKAAQAATQMIAADSLRAAANQRLARKQMLSTQEAMEQQKRREQQQVQDTATRAAVIDEKVQQISLGNTGELARAFILSEILAKPMGLRDQGSHNLSM